MEKNTKPLMVSIRCVTYNHEPFIRQCLEGFVMQKTNFRFEAIVHDDASTDGTAAIILEYAEKYPDIIKPIIETENQYSKHDGSLGRIMNAHMHGKYIAMCEGDDYWTDPYKLQKQVDFLESHPDYVMCTHRYKVFYQSEGEFGTNYPIGINESFTYDIDYYISHKCWVTQILTLVYRNDMFDINYFSRYKISKDAVFCYFLLKSGKGYFMNDLVSIYRVHNKGVWSGISKKDKNLDELIAYLSIYDVEKTKNAAENLKSGLNKMGYLGISFFRSYMKDYLKVLSIIKKEFGVFPMIKSLVVSINLLSR